MAGAILFLVTGCLSPPSAERPPARPLGSELESFEAPEDNADALDDVETSAPERVASERAVRPRAPEDLAEPEAELQLGVALSRALLQSPELAAYSYAVREREALELQARLLPNPELAGEVENFGGSGLFEDFEAAESTISLSQLIELGGKRAKRLRVAELGSALAAWDYEAARLAVLTSTTQAFVGVLAAQRTLELVERTLELAEEVLAAIAARVAAGQSSPLEVTRAQVVVSRSRIARERAARALTSARVRLASSWGESEPRFERAAGDLDTVGTPPPVADVLAFVAESPDIARWSLEITERRARVDLEESQAIPDVHVQGGFRMFEESDDTAFVVGMSLPLPIFDRGQGKVRAARIDVSKAREEQRAAEVRVRMQLLTAYESLLVAHAEVSTLQGEILPAARDAFEGTRTSFEEGKLGYLDVLDAERTLFDVHQQHVDALAEYHRARAEVEGLIGRSLDDVARSQAPQTPQTPQPEGTNP